MSKITTERILMVACFARNVREQVKRHLLMSFEAWQVADYLNCFCFEAEDWFAIQELQTAIEENCDFAI